MEKRPKRFQTLVIAALLCNGAGQIGTLSAQDLPAERANGRFFAATEANIRDIATSEGSTIVRKARRGEQFSGVVVRGVDGTSLWLELNDSAGFIGVVNLSSQPRPAIVSPATSANESLTIPCAFQEAPQDGSVTKVTLEAGQSVRAIGVVAGGRTEYALPRGGVGYRRSVASCQVIQTANSSGTTNTDWGLQITWRGDQASGVRSECLSPPSLRPYYEAARVDGLNTRRRSPRGEIFYVTGYAPVNRSWSSLTISAVGIRTTQLRVYFSQSLEVVGEVFLRNGYGISKDDVNSRDELRMIGLDGVDNSARIYRVKGGERRYGQAVWVCDVLFDTDGAPKVWPSRVP
jgi:hypothetical protein